ncbi:phosphatidate phosphatase LPIN3 isoform X2 [Frankliniella occidentalis]|uniref:phosphatidate phosphatase n=1 Tax=Frankliniella occidentalis TaxID=133901 RepID=A0A9C6U961_FRAOC|nr:phosphatidate phosphatase LPIN3 isoform X2 [Frankliniella occidentalis]
MYSMNYIGKFISNFRDFYNEINTATLTGAIDVIVVEQPDGSYTCSPFHVRFGKLGVLRSREKVVDIEINGEPLDIHMKLGDSGEAFFVEELDELSRDVPPHLACSPIPTEGGFPIHYHHDTELDPLGTLGPLAAAAAAQGLTEEWSRRRCNSEVVKRTPKETPTQKFAQDDIDEHKPSNDLPYEWPHEYGPATEFASDAYPVMPPPPAPASSATTAAASSVPKTFKAETVSPSESSERTRKLSAVSGEFRPITSDSDSPSGGSRPAPQAATGPGAAEVVTTPEDGPEEASKVPGKRRRRKRSVMKKKGGLQRKNSEAGEASDTSASVVWESACSVLSAAGKQGAEVAVFTMDDVDGLQRTSPSPSSSTAADTMSADTPSSPSDLSKAAASLAAEISRDLSKLQDSSTDFHFFSDTEILPGNNRKSEAILSRTTRSASDGILATKPVTKPINVPLVLPVPIPSSLLKFFPDEEDSRPCSPVQSDTEFETHKRPGSAGGGHSADPSSGVTQSWRWGELPSPPPKATGTGAGSPDRADNPSSYDEATKQQDSAAAQKSMLSGMFSFMKKTKRIRHNPESEGIYLSELNVEDLDPEVAALYFPTSYHRQGCPAPGECSSIQRDEDAESGNGPSLPQSPHSVEGAIGGPKSVDSDFEEPKHSFFDKKHFGDISISLCGNLNNTSGSIAEKFLQHLVTFEDFVNNPKILEDPNLVVRHDGQYYNWKAASPLMVSLLVFRRPLPQDVLKTLATVYMPDNKANVNSQGKQNDNVAGGRGYSSWFYWRRNDPKKMASDPGVGLTSSPYESDTAIKAASASTILEMPDDTYREGENSERDGRPLTLNIPPVGTDLTMSQDRNIGQDQGLHGLPKDSLREEGYNGSNSSDSDDAQRNKSGVKIPVERRSYYQAPEKYRKTLRLSSEQIAQLNLQEGTNEVVFSVTTAYQGTTRCKCNIYKWKYDDKIVISDIDGTITKSDVLGHILPIVGKDWAQSGVAQLFTKIQNNGYRLLYLSARAIGQARVTREYLRSIKQDDLSLPDGPLLLNPTSLMSALHREVIERKPEEFKISCLRDIQALFPSHCKPFYAGYGNKINDVWAYRAVGIPIFRIFTINHRGELKHELTQTFQSSYLNMSCIVDQMFPARLEDTSEDYTSFIFWREPVDEVHIDLGISSISSVSNSLPAKSGAVAEQASKKK